MRFLRNILNSEAKKSILLVSDNEQFAETTLAQLEECYRVQRCSYADTARALHKEEKFDLIIIDIVTSDITKSSKITFVSAMELLIDAKDRGIETLLVSDVYYSHLQKKYGYDTAALRAVAPNRINLLHTSLTASLSNIFEQVSRV